MAASTREGSASRSISDADQRPLLQLADGGNRGARHLDVVVIQQHAQLAFEQVRQDRNQPRRLEPCAPAFLARFLDHLRQHQPRGLDVLGGARARQERHQGGPDREVLEVAELPRSAASGSV